MSEVKCVSVVLCGDVLFDQHGHRSLIGCFTQLFAMSLPAVHPQMHISVALTNLKGKVPISVTLRSPGDKKLFMAEMTADCPDPLMVHELDFALHSTPLEEFGTYYADVMHGAELLGSRRFQLLKAQVKAA